LDKFANVDTQFKSVEHLTFSGMIEVERHILEVSLRRPTLRHLLSGEALTRRLGRLVMVGLVILAATASCWSLSLVIYAAEPGGRLPPSMAQVLSWVLVFCCVLCCLMSMSRSVRDVLRYRLKCFYYLCAGSRERSFYRERLKVPVDLELCLETPEPLLRWHIWRTHGVLMERVKVEGSRPRPPTNRRRSASVSTRGELVIDERTLRLDLTRDPLVKGRAHLRLRELGSRRWLDLTLRLNSEDCEALSPMAREGVQLVNQWRALEVLSAVCCESGVVYPWEINQILMKRQRQPKQSFNRVTSGRLE